MTLAEVRILQNWSRCFSINPRSTERERRYLGEKKQLIRSRSRSSLHRARQLGFKIVPSYPSLIGFLSSSSSAPAVLPFPPFRILAHTHPREPSRNTWIGFECSQFIAIDCGTVATQRLPYALFVAIIFCRRCCHSILSTSRIRPRYRDGKTRRCGRTVIIMCGSMMH